MTLRLRLPPPGTLTASGPTDPLRYYYKPLVGWIFSGRINAGLRLLGERRFQRLLEIGFGSGLLIPTLSSIAGELYGLDLEPATAELRAALEKLGIQPRELAQGDIRKLPWPDRHFDGAVAFSILEHLRRDQLEPALAEVARVLAPGGTFLVGCPAVHKAMNAAFAAIGFKGIENHHFSGIPDVLGAAAPHFAVQRKATLPGVMAVAPLGWAPYNCALLVRK